MNLYSFQQEGRDFLAGRNVALLADEPGLGKTVQAIMAVNQLPPTLGRCVRVHVVCPASVCESWRRHIADLAVSIDRSHFGTTWRVESYDMAARWHEGNGTLPIDVLILDEAHYLKNRRAKRTTAIYGPKLDRLNGLAASASYVFLLTGTPVPNNPSELWSHMHALFPESIPSKRMPTRPMNYFEFEQHFCKVRADFWGHRHIEGGKNLTELQLRLSPYTLRRMKDEVMRDLPPVQISLLPLTVSPADVKRIAAEAAGYDETMPPAPTLRRFTGLAKVEPMVEWVRDWFAGGGGKLVLFAHHREVIDGLNREFPEASVVTGDTSGYMRQTAIDRFQNIADYKLFIGQLQAAGTGITLTAASTVILVESSWVPAENEQAAMRIHRIGQKNACDVRFAHAAGTIDEHIQATAMRKIETIRQIFA